MIKNLSLSDADMTYIPHDLFNCLRNKSLSKLSLEGNHLLLYPLVFADLTHVSTLDISHCHLKTIDPQYFDGMVGLRKLLADNNEISSFNPSATTWRINLHRMELGLEDCEAITQHAFRGLQNLKTLFLHQNVASGFCSMVIDITQLQELTFLPGSYITHLTLNTPNLKEFSFSNSDLGMGWLYTKELFTVAESIEKINIHAGLRIRDIKREDQSAFLGKLYKLHFLDLSKNRFYILPSAVFKTFLSLKSLYISQSHIETITPNAFIGLNSLETLDLTENKILSLPGDILMHTECLINLHLDSNILSYLDKDLFIYTPNLTTLTLPYNRFVGFNSSTFEPLHSSLIWLDISGNNLVCTCDIDWLVKYIGDYIYLLNGNQTLCSTTSATLKHLRGKPITTFQYKKYCGLDVHLVLWISAAVLTLFIAVSMTAIISYHYRWLLRYKIFLLKLAVLGYREIQDGQNRNKFDYDINIMFLESDTEWAINILRPGLDSRLPNFDRIAFGDANLTLGMHYFDAVYENVEKSYKTILLLSRAAVQDHIFMTKFRIAMNHVT